MIGQRHTFADGYTFLETLHGPNVEGHCVDCGGRAYHALEAADHVPPRCSTCGRARHGAPVHPRRAPLAQRMAQRAGSGGVNAYPYREARLVPAPGRDDGAMVAMVREVEIGDCPPAAREVWRALAARGRPARALHTVAVVKGSLDERVSVQSLGVIATWKRSATPRRPSLLRTATGRPRPFVPGIVETWTGVALVRYSRMTITKLMLKLRNGDI